METDVFRDRTIAHCEKVLRAIEEMIDGRVSADVENIEVSTPSGRRVIGRMPMGELLKLHRQYNEELESLRAELGETRGRRRNVLTRF